MKVIFRGANDMFQFCEFAKTLQSDVLLHSGANISVDGKSSLGLIALGFNKPFDIEIIERDKSEVERFVAFLTERRILCV